MGTVSLRYGANDNVANLTTTARQPIGRFPKGTYLQLAPRYLEFATGLTPNPAAQPSEGPYLRVYPASDLSNGVGPWAQPGLQNISWTKAGVPTFVNVDTANAPDGQNDGSGFYYELDANQGAVYLPFDCSCELVSYRNGIFVYDFISYQDPPQPASFLREYRQTRIIKGNAVRTLWVPYGAFEYSFNCAQLAANQPVWYSEDATVALSGTSNNTTAGFNWGRNAIPQARKVTVQPGASAGPDYQPALTFYIKF